MTRKPFKTDAALLDALFDAAVDAIIVEDETGRMQRVNPAACKMFGYTPDEMIGEAINLLMPAPAAGLHDGFMQNYLQTGLKKIIGIGRELKGQRKDKTLFSLHISVGRVDNGDNVLFVGVLHDLTRRKSIEEALERSQRMEALARMTGGVAHDFNNLLTVITGSLELMEMRLRDETVHPLLKDALMAAETGSHLTEQLLAFARHSAQSPIVTDINSVIAQLISPLRRLIGTEIRLETHLPNDLPNALADPAQLQTAILNLALNARDAMPGGGNMLIETGAVFVGTCLAEETGMKPGCYVRLSLADNGGGMSTQAQHQAFDPYFTTKPIGKGTGLGLSMVYGFVKQLGGHAAIHSQPGRGTTVSLFLPLSPDPMVTAGAEPKPDPRDVGQFILAVKNAPQR